MRSSDRDRDRDSDNDNGNSGSSDLPDIPHCPRTREEAGHVDWLTFPRCDNFNVCPSCYEGVFARGRGGKRGRFAHALVPAPFRPADRPLACDFGRSPWYQFAWLRIHKKHNKQYDDDNDDNDDDGLALFHLIRAVLECARAQDQPCAGPREVYRSWYSVRDPGAGTNGGGVSAFTVCYTCARLVETILPNLKGVFVPAVSSSGGSSGGSSAEPFLSVCAMHAFPSTSTSGGDEERAPRKRFVDYLSTFETVSDAAAQSQRSNGPSQDMLRDLAARIGALAAQPECRRDAPVRDAWWYIMKSIPEFTVCEACFQGVVAPAIQQLQQPDEYGSDHNGNGSGNGTGPSVAGDFHVRPQRLPLAACQLWSERMRDVFARAVRRRDLGYLESRVRERRAREQEY